MQYFVVFLTLFLAVHSQRVFTGDQVLRINAESEEHIQILQTLQKEQEMELDFWIHPVSVDLPVDIHVPSVHLQKVKIFLQEHNIPFSVMINNLQVLLEDEQAEMEKNRIKERSSKSLNFGAYHDLYTIYNWMDSLVTEYPNLVSKEHIGLTYENHAMYVLKFSTGGSNRPAIWIDAGIHAREWVSSATAVWTANKVTEILSLSNHMTNQSLTHNIARRQIATDYGHDSSLTSLLNKMDIYLMIVTNPDGYVYTHTSDRMWRKTRSVNPGSMCRGVDPNRNWDAGFGGPGASSNPCSDSYHGPYAHSEVEVKNVVNFIQSHGQFKSFISIHAYSQLLMYPYGYTCTNVPDQAELDSVGRSAVNALSSLYGTQYKVGNICRIIYQASGGSIDWSYDIGIKYSFAFELRDTGRYGFLLPASQIIPTASETWLALKHIMEHVRDNAY